MRNVLKVAIALALVAGLVPAANAADRTSPRIVKARMKDRDNDGKADRIVLTYSEKIRHRRDRDGRYPFKVGTYRIKQVKAARNSRKLVIVLAEKGKLDGGAHPAVTYSRTRKQPVRDAARNQARGQRFTKTLSWGVRFTVSRAGTGAGTVTSTPQGLDCGTICSRFFRRGSSVTLAATPDATSVFEGWSGACTGTDDCTLKASRNRTVTATFTSVGTQLIVNRVGAGMVTSSPAGIACGVTCAATYPTGSVVNLTAEPASGVTFAGWSGGCTGIDASCVVDMTTDQTVTATFIGGKNLTTTKSGDGTGTVTSSPAGISCGSICESGFGDGETVTLTAVPASGSTFGGWGGACGGSSTTCVVTMDADKSVSAAFSLISPKSLTVVPAGNGGGTVSSSPAGIDCGTTCVGSFAPGSVVTLTAAPGAGSYFAGWSGGCAGTSLNCVLTLTEDTSVTANFGKPVLTVTVLGTGTVSSLDGGIVGCSETCPKTYSVGDPVTLVATPGLGSIGVTWSGCDSTPTPLTCLVTMNSDRAVTATFTSAGLAQLR
jgi:hypothetical protein